jgi:signal transduction histidine kinase/HAMP domain-containing protein
MAVLSAISDMSKRSRPKSLARLIFSWGMITTVLLLFLSIQISKSVFNQRINEEAIAMGRAEITRIAFVAERMIQKDRFLLKDIIAQAATDHRLQDILILDPQRKVVYSNSNDKIALSAFELPPFQQSILRDLEQEGSMVTYVAQGESTIGFAKSFIWPPTAGQIRSNQWGYVLIMVDLAGMKQDRWLSIMGEELMISAVYILTLILLLIGVFFSIKRPLQSLTMAAKRFSQGDFSYQVEELGLREMKELAEAFNMMSSEIQMQLSALQTSENTFRALIENSPVGIVTFDSDRQKIYQNEAFLQITGLSAEQLENLTEDQFEAVLKHLEQRQIGESNAAKSIDTSLKTTDNAGARLIEIYNPDLRVIARFQIHPLNATIHSILYFQDITSMSKIDRMKSEFITTAAHELRTPMTTILGYAELLLDRPLREPQRQEMIRSIHTQAQSIVHLLEELLNVALIESRADRAFDIEETDIAPLIESMANSFMVAGDPRKITLLPASPLAKVRIDREKISQALKNCLSNAYKFSDSNSEVILEARMHGADEVMIRIQDFGIGMSAEVQEKIFEKFFRADSSGHIPGTGLGMTLVKQIIDHHHGRIEVVSEPGQGTRISIYLPVAHH